MSVNANELRMGNLVYYGKAKVMVSTDFLYYLKNQNNSCKPIPLTPELLVKIGFDKKNYDNHKKNPHIPKEIQDKEYCDFRMNDFIIEKCDNLFRVLLEDGNNLYEIKNKLQYLHQLQNLYFALTGNELEIKL